VEETEMTKAEKYYDKEIAPKLLELAKDAAAHGLNFLALVEWKAGGHGRTFHTAFVPIGLPLQMANWSAKCGGNVDAFWMAIQRYGMENGHSSIFLREQGIPESTNPAVRGRESSSVPCTGVVGSLNQEEGK
jgi:hypothetical protein